MGQAAGLFNGSGEQTLISRITPTADQRQFLQEQWNLMAEHLKKELGAKHGYPISTWLQGSYKFGTLIKPVRFGDEYDVDVGVYFAWDEEEEDIEPTARQLRDWVQAELVEYEKTCDPLRRVEAPPKERCSRAFYERQFHIDTPTYHLSPQSDTRRLACMSDEWEHSDPKAIYKWFRDRVGDDNRDQLRRVVRYMKAWAAICFEDAPGSRPTSIFLTVLVTQAYESLWSRLVWLADDDALIKVIRVIHERLFAERRVPNPVDAGEDLNRMAADDWEGFLPRLEALLDVADRADEAEDEATASLIWSEAFSFLMPLPETKEVEVVEETSGRAVMQLPEIDIEVYESKPRAFRARHRNEVPGVPKDCELVFKIVNPHIVPEYATVEWTVRNEGDEADYRSDLGHRFVGIRMLEVSEHTAYAGRHFMDCVVRMNGQVYAVRRVPVTIRDVRPVARNPPAPAYVKLRTMLKRRGR